MKRTFAELAEAIAHSVRYDRLVVFAGDRRFDTGFGTSEAPTATAIVPLFASGALIGRLHVTRGGDPFSQEERKALAYLSPHIAVSVHSIAESDARLRLLDEAEALLEIGQATAALFDPVEVVARAIHVASRYLPFPTQFAVYGDPDDDGRWRLLGARTPDTPKLFALQSLSLRPSDLGEDRAGAVLSGEPWFASDAQSEPGVMGDLSRRFGTRSLLTVPLRSGDETLGVVCVCNPVTNVSMTDAERKLIRGVADQVAISLRNARLGRQNMQAVEDLRALSNRLWTVQEEERERIARELHDEAGQAMTALKLNLDLARREIEERGGAERRGESERRAENEPIDLARVQKRIGEAVELAGKVLDELRRISTDLRPGGLHELGLVPTLRALIDGFGKRNQLATEFDATAEVVPHPDSEAASTVFRFVKEALTNVAQHARATRVRVSLETAASGMLRVSVQDDGVGIDSIANIKEKQIGLLGLRERARVLGGSLTLASAAGKGATLSLEIPAGMANP